MNPDDGVVALLESQVRFGVTLYTSEDGNDATLVAIMTLISNRLEPPSSHLILQRLIDLTPAPTTEVDLLEILKTSF